MTTDPPPLTAGELVAILAILTCSPAQPHLVERFDQVQQKLRELVERVGTAGLEKDVQEALDYTVETAVSEARELRQFRASLMRAVAKTARRQETP